MPAARAISTSLRPATAETEQVAEDIAEIGEHILEIARTAVSAVLQSVMTVGVIDLPFLLITEDLIGSSRFLELRLGFLIVRIPVRMILHRQFTIGLLDLTVRGVPKRTYKIS